MPRKSDDFKAKVVTGNRLNDGAVVFLKWDLTWSGRIDDAEVAKTTASADELLRIATEHAGRNIVVNPYLIEVERDGCKIIPLRLRERIRAHGVTIHPPALADTPIW